MAEPSFATAADRAAQDPFNPFPAPENCNMAQIIFLTGMYGYVLFQASNLISDGSELLLLVPAAAPVVGSVVLPILGAVPDGMMVLFSGLGPDAQNQVSVGVGALAGSTVMLLTLPWFLAILAGRVSLKDGKPTYQRPAGADPTTWDKLDPPGNLSLFYTGIGYGPEIVQNAWTMLYTMLGYVIIQGSAFMVDKMPKPLDISLHTEHHMLKNEARYENTFALVGLFICIGFFGWYLWKMWKESQGSGAVSDAIAESTIQAMREGTLTLRGAMATFRDAQWSSMCKKGDLNEVLLSKESMDEVRRMCKVLAPFFAHYDANGDNAIDFEEFRMIFKDVGENLSRDAQNAMFKAADTNRSGDISFEEFVACLMSFALDPNTNLQEIKKPKYATNPNNYLKNEEGEEEEEEEDVPEDLADLEPEEQQKRIKIRAAYQMALGTLLVLIFSDPMVDLLSELGVRLDVSAFYISFVLAPLASNASELVAAYNYAKKRTCKSITTSLSTLEGAAIMNNTFCLAIFLALVYFQNLAWEFSAETTAIILIQVMIALSCVFRRVHRLLDAYLILSLYPLCLATVYVLENYVGWD